MFRPGQRVIIGPGDPAQYSPIVRKYAGLTGVLAPGWDEFKWTVTLDDKATRRRDLAVNEEEIGPEEGPW